MKAISGQAHGTPVCNIVIWPIDQYFVSQECSLDIEGARALLTEAGYPDGIRLEPFLVESWRQRCADDHLGLQARCGSQRNDHF